MKQGLRSLMVVVLIVMIGGCSLALSGPDPLRASNVAPQCDAGKGLVALDWVLGAVMATVALAALEADESEAAAVSALTAGAFIASATRGNGVVNKCREEFASYSPAPDPEEEVARRPVPRRFEDPYAAPSDLPARRIVKPPPAAANAAPAVNASPGPNASRPIATPTAPPSAAAPARPARTPAPPPAAAPAADDDWSDFWTELP